MKVGSLLLFLIFLGCSSQPQSPTVAIINGQKISTDDFRQYFETERWKFGAEANFDPKQIQQTKGQVLDIIFRDFLLIQEANKRGISVSPQELDASIKEFRSSYPSSQDFDRLLKLRGWSYEAFKERRKSELTIKKLVEHVTTQQIVIADEDLTNYYETNRQEFNHPEQVRARQIVTDSLEKANALRAMLVKGETFEEVALRYSLSPDRKTGGDLGWFARNVMPREFDQVCFSLKPGELSSVVKTPYGFHIFQVLERRTAGTIPLEGAKEKIRQTLMEGQGKEVFQKWYEHLHAQAQVKINEEILNQFDGT